MGSIVKKCLRIDELNLVVLLTCDANINLKLIDENLVLIIIEVIS